MRPDSACPVCGRTLHVHTGIVTTCLHGERGPLLAKHYVTSVPLQTGLDIDANRTLTRDNF